MVCLCSTFFHFIIIGFLIIFAVLEVEFERAKYSVSEGDNVTVNILASNNFTSGFAVSISHNGGNGELSVCMYICSTVRCFMSVYLVCLTNQTQLSTLC